MNIKKIIEQKFMLVIALATVIGFSAFNILDEPESGWYAISADPGDDITNPADQKIVSFYGTSTAPTGSCSPTQQAQDPCAVFLNMEDYDGPANPLGLSVQAITSAPNNAEIEANHNGSNDGYSREVPE